MLADCQCCRSYWRNFCILSQERKNTKYKIYSFWTAHALGLIPTCRFQYAPQEWEYPEVKHWQISPNPKPLSKCEIKLPRKPKEIIWIETQRPEGKKFRIVQKPWMKSADHLPSSNGKKHEILCGWSFDTHMITYSDASSLTRNRWKRAKHQ
jgi:hypothetical protein